MESVLICQLPDLLSLFLLSFFYTAAASVIPVDNDKKNKNLILPQC